jgi:DNA-binding NarL/FixJ family response regulator
MIKVLVADDHAVVRAGIAHVLANASDIELVGEAADGAEALELARTRAADVVLMDLSMPVLDGIDATRRIREEVPAAQVVVLTSFSDRDRIFKALDAGAIGYLLKDAEPDELCEGIRAAARGESPLAPKAATALVEARTRREPADELSEREREVLALVAEGLPNKLIARRLGISEKTVKAHLTSVFRQIGVDDRTQAALWAQQHGYAQAPRS